MKKLISILLCSLMMFVLIGCGSSASAKKLTAEEYGAKLFANGATPGGVLEHPGVLKVPARISEPGLWFIEEFAVSRYGSTNPRALLHSWAEDIP